MLPDTSANATLDPDILRRLAEIAETEPGWHTSINLAWRVGGDDRDRRRLVTHTMRAIGRCALLRTMGVWHNNEILSCYFLDGEAIGRYLGEVA
jgi:hypothetical protein